MIDSLYFPLVFLAAMVGVGVAAFAIANRDRPGALPLALFALAGSFWSLSQGLIVARQVSATMEFWTQISFSLSVVIPLAWLLLVLQYTGNSHRVSLVALGALLIEPIVFINLVWTNASHNFVWSGGNPAFVGGLQAYAIEFGLGFWAHQVYAYLLFAAGAAILMRMLFRPDKFSRWQSTALLASITLPILANLVFIFGFFPSGLDPTGVASVLAAAIMAAAVFETEMHGIAPVTREIGREAILEEMDDVILILDDDNHILDVNPAGEVLLGADAEEALGRPVGEFIPGLESALASGENRTEVELERDGKLRHYDIQVSTLSRGYGTFSGKVLSLRDVTDQLEQRQRIDVLNRLLRHNVRNELNLIRGKIQLAQDDVQDPTARERLANATETVDDVVARSNKVGRLSRMLDSEQAEQIDIAAELVGQHENGELIGDAGNITLDLPDELHVAGGKSLVAAFEELVTNGIEHNDSDDPHVTVRVNDAESDEDHVVITVMDNGPGINSQEWQTITEGRETPLQHSSGVGLWLVNWVVRRAGGSVSFDNSDGSTVRVRLPRAETDGADADES